MLLSCGNLSSKTRGITMIMVAAVLAILAALATGFYSLMVMQTRSATRYADSIRADMMARAGIEAGIASIRDQCYRKTEDPSDPWFMFDYMHGAVKRTSFAADYSKNLIDDDHDGTVDNDEEKSMPFSGSLSSSAGINSDRYTLNVFDAASRINVNASDNLAVMLDNLCRVIGPPLVAADQDAILPRRWAAEGAAGGLFDNGNNANDTITSYDIYYTTYTSANAPIPLFVGGKLNPDTSGRPTTRADGTALYGDGYAIAGYRARKGRFNNIEDVKSALTYVKRNTGNADLDKQLEELEREVKYAAIRDYITVDSWIDTSTVCVGKFEWVNDPNTSGVYDIAIDRDKSWIPDDPVNDPLNARGSLRGCYISIVNGHGAGQFRRIRTNGADWIQLETFKDPQKPAQEVGFTIPPGPISSYMIIAPEDAKLADKNNKAVTYSYVGQPPKLPPTPLPVNENYYPMTKIDASGNTVFEDDPYIDYSVRPLCIHRAPININTASDKVLAALFLGINVQQGHHLSIGTEADLAGTRAAWKTADPAELEPYLYTAQGLKRVPVVAGKMVLNTDFPVPPTEYDFAYLNSNGAAGAPNFVVQGTKTLSEAQELAYRIIVARTFRSSDPADLKYPYIDPSTGNPSATARPGFERGPIKSWDDLYFRVIAPWDEKRLSDGWSDVNGNGIMDGWVDLNRNQVVEANEVDTYRIASRARMIMAHFNSNTDILKFNPNIEWIDRWGRNFTEMEPVMIYPNQNPLPNNVLPTYVQYGTFWNGIKHWSGRYDWCPALLADFDSERAGAYIVRSFRYKSDEMIDKTDMNRSTTEFAFDSGGIFEIQSTGQVMKRGELLSERKLQALVKVYDVWRESTQRQFVQGTIETGPGLGSASPPTMGATGSTHSGQIVRDAANGVKYSVQRLPLNTTPEPLVPLQFRLNKNVGLGVNYEVVDTTARDAWGNPKDITIPDVIANKILPSGYDGQIVLATNTSNFDSGDEDKDSFLASFDGDLDTVTCLGNGREQAKMPGTPLQDGQKYRVTDTTGLLGVLNDTLWDQDPMASNVPNTYMWGKGGAGNESVIGGALRGLNEKNYWENALIRTGDLRTDGVYLTSPGVGGNDATLKYLIGWTDSSGVSHPNSQEEDTLPPGTYPQGGKPSSGSYVNRANFDLMQSFKGSQDGEGFLLSMWAKPTWRHDDNRTHEFFNASNPGHYLSGRGFVFQKFGRYAYANWGDGGGFSGCARRKNDLLFGMEGEAQTILDRDNVVQLHGGANRVKYTSTPPHDESPGYRVQPFRWHYLGVRLNYCQTKLTTANTQRGHWYRDGGAHADLKRLINWCNRPFISTSTLPEDAVYDWNPGGSDSPIWPINYYMYQCNTLINGNVFSRAPDVGRTYHVSRKPTFLNDGNNVWTDATDDKGNAGLGGTRNVDGSKGADYGGRTAQDVRWDWANPATDTSRNANTVKVFSINNLNFGETDDGNDSNDAWIYRHMPEDGTYAVIDEFKISKREKTMQDDQSIRRRDRITGTGGGSGVRGGEMRTSRYYLPPSPQKASNCPTFTSQSLLRSLKGSEQSSKELVTVARVTWTVFTPRFMGESKYIAANHRYQRSEYIYKGSYNNSGVNPGSQTTEVLPYHGPFDWVRYNSEAFNKDDTLDPLTLIPGSKNRYFSVKRPSPYDYKAAGKKQAHSTRGVEVELLDGNTPINKAFVVAADGSVTPAYNNTTFTDPDMLNRLGDIQNPVKVLSSNLRYRVRFRYPVDPLVDTGGLPDDRGGMAVNNELGDAGQQYLLDTPVFDDISITYFTKPRVLSYKEMLE